MEPRPLNFIADACGGDLWAGPPDRHVRRVCTDSRQVQAGDLFFALRGPRFDGHDFLPAAAQRGAAGVVVGQGQADRAARLPAATAVVRVDDPRVALGRLAARYRQDFALPIVAVAGSNGKTTTKELLASVFRQRFQTLASEANYNNDLGAALTLLRLERHHEVAVLEVGTNHPGELGPLVLMIQPRFGVLTNVAREHLEFFGDLAGVAQEEGWVAELLPDTGKLLINGDSPWAPTIVQRTRADVVRVGFGEHNDWRAGHVRVGWEGTTFEVFAPEGAFSGVHMLRVVGQHQVPNGLLAVVAGAELGVSPEQVRRGLAECPPLPMRLQLWEAQGWRVLDDAYNANADSMAAALQTLCDLPAAGRRIAVLGDMAELGPHTAEAHREVGRRTAELGLGPLVTVGRWAPETAKAARAAGLPDVREFSEVEAAAVAVRELVRPGDVVLLKASRAARFERIAAALRAASPPSASAGRAPRRERPGSWRAADESEATGEGDLTHACLAVG